MSAPDTPTGEVPASVTLRLLNRTQLAELLDVDRKYVTAMCCHAANPFRFALGGRTTYADAIAWLRNNPTFTGIAGYRAKRALRSSQSEGRATKSAPAPTHEPLQRSRLASRPCTLRPHLPPARSLQ